MRVIAFADADGLLSWTSVADAIAAGHRLPAPEIGDMLLSSEGLEEASFFTPDNITSQFRQSGVWVWHIPFFWIPHLP